MKAWLSDQHVEFEAKEILSDPPSKEEITWMASQVENGAKGLLSSFKVQMNDSTYVEHIQGKEDTLTDEDYINLYHQFPDLLAKPIVTNREQIVLGFDKEALANKFVTPTAG